MKPETSELNEEQFQANRYELVSRLADDLAHEIKNPLNAIVINLEVLRARVRKGNGPAALDRADVIEAEVRRLHHLVDRMLQLLRPDRDEIPSLALDRALDEILPLIEAQTRLARNELVIDCNASVYVAVRRDVLKFALLNLFTAVHERLGEGGGTLSFSCDTNSAEVRLFIRDLRGDGVVGGRDALAERAQIARALLASYGGRVEYDATGVTVAIPRAVAL